MTRPIVVGGGWAGLAAAVELADAGLRPRLLEAGPRLGGRAATLPVSGSRADAPPLDHGQHLLIGAYTGVEALLHRLGIPLDDAFVRVRPGLRVAGTDGGTALALDLAPLPAPLHSFIGLLRARGLDWRQRLALPRLLPKRGGPPFPGDETVANLFHRTGQPEAAIQRLWVPLCLATLNTPPERASAKLFMTVVREVFQGPRRAAELWFPRYDLGALLAEPARAHIEACGGEVLTNHRVRRLLGKEGSPLIVGAATREAEFRGPVVLAVAPWHATRLLGLSAGAVDGSEWGFGGVEQLTPSPIDTVYLRYPESTRLAGSPLLGFEEPPHPWLIDRRTCGQPGWFGLAISAPGPHSDWSREQLANWATRLIARARPDWPAPRETVVIREKRATFAATPEAEARRPLPGRAASGLWLAGDYTATGLPATLEGAVRSGVQCAQQLIREGH